jgi:hypothetical protein
MFHLDVTMLMMVHRRRPERGEMLRCYSAGGREGDHKFPTPTRKSQQQRVLCRRLED